MIRIRTFLMNSIGMKFDPDPEDGAWSFVYGDSVSKSVTEYGQYIGFDTTTTINGQTYYTLNGGGAYATSEGTINFVTTKANQQVQISLSPSSQANGDYICAGKLDSDDIVNMQGKTSGTTATTVTYTVATPGNHYVKILFRNNASGTSNNNKGHARLIPFTNTVTGLNQDVLVVNMKSFSAWKLVSKPDWITLSTAANGTLTTSTTVERGRLDLTVTAAINYGTARSGNIVLQETKKNIQFTIPVTQTACPNQVILSRDYLYKNDDPSESTKITVDINGANTSWTASCGSKGSWFSISPTTGGDNTEVTISWNGNQSSGAAARSNVVTFTGNAGGTDQLTVYQEKYICHCNCQNYCQCDIDEDCPAWYTNRCYCEMDNHCTCESHCECNNNCDECATECHNVCSCDSECHEECSTECHAVGSCNGTYTQDKCVSGYGSCNGTYTQDKCVSGYGSCNGTYTQDKCVSGYDTCTCECECTTVCEPQCACNSGNHVETCSCNTGNHVETCSCNTGNWVCSTVCTDDCGCFGQCSCDGTNHKWTCNCNSQCSCDSRNYVSTCSCDTRNWVCSSVCTDCTCNDQCVCNGSNHVYVCKCNGSNHVYKCSCDSGNHQWTCKCNSVTSDPTCSCEFVCSCHVHFEYSGCRSNEYYDGDDVMGEDVDVYEHDCEVFNCNSECKCDLQLQDGAPNGGNCTSVSYCQFEAYGCDIEGGVCSCNTKTAGSTTTQCACNTGNHVETCSCNTGNWVCSTVCTDDCGCFGQCSCDGTNHKWTCNCNSQCSCDSRNYVSTCSCDTRNWVCSSVCTDCTCNDQCVCNGSNHVYVCKCNGSNHVYKCSCDSGNHQWTCNCNSQCTCDTTNCDGDCDTNCTSKCSCHNQCSTHCISKCSCHNQCSTHCASKCSCHNQCTSNCTNVCTCDSKCTSECASECHNVCYCDSDICTCVSKCFCDGTNCVAYGYCTTEKECPEYCTKDHKCACDNYQAPV